MRLFMGLLLTVLMISSSYAKDNSSHLTHTANTQKIGLEEQLGKFIPMDTVFTDSKGNTKSLKEIVTVPTVIAPVYYTCPSVCNLLQSKLAAVLPRVKLTPGKDFQVISLSFDEKDTPQIAAQKKRNYMKAMDNQFPETDWTFLTGDEHAIRTILNAAGYFFRRSGKDFVHPTATFIITPNGKIVRYIYGSNFLPFDITMAATEAAEGKVGWSVKRVLSICFSYDSEGKKYVFNIVRVSGVVVVFFAITLFLVLFVFGKKKPRG